MNFVPPQGAKIWYEGCLCSSVETGDNWSIDTESDDWDYTYQYYYQQETLNAGINNTHCVLQPNDRTCTTDEDCCPDKYIPYNPEDDSGGYCDDPWDFCWADFQNINSRVFFIS